MFSLFLVILSAIAINGQNALPGSCKVLTPAANFDWNTFLNITWYQLYTTDKSNLSEWITLKSDKDGDKYKIRVMGYKNNKEQTKNLNVTKTGTADFELDAARKFTFIMYEEGKYAVFHECLDHTTPQGFAEKTSYTYILSSRKSLDFGDYMKITERLKEADIKENIVDKDFKTTVQLGKTSSGGAVTQALAALMVACAALMRFI
ncbi:uncharacterized protein LOC143919304 [Arctopsyche grandis]|uniref:uncharacterized protein LOC143919304 n=1 Tax=Arctopsyche grandis TaxID=121162 RepID=UPI00406D8BB5